MKNSLAILLIVISLSATGQVRANSDDCTVPVAQWQPRKAVERIAKKLGITLRRIKIDDGCYQIRGRDASGRNVKIKINPQTLEIIEVKYKN